MSCDRVLDQLSPYLDGELSPFEEAQVESHLRRCAACAAEMDALRRTVALLKDLEPVPVPDNFRARLRARLAQLPPPLPAERRPAAAPRWRRWTFGPAVAAAVAAAVTLLVNTAGPQAPGLDPQPPVAGSATPGGGQVAFTPAPGPETPAPAAPGPATPDVAAPAPVPAQNPVSAGPAAGGGTPTALSGTGFSQSGDRPASGAPASGHRPETAEPPRGPVGDGAAGYGVRSASHGPTTGSPAVPERRLEHMSYRVLLAVPDPDGARTAVGDLLNQPQVRGRVVGEERLAGGGVSLTLEVPAEAVETVLEGLVSLGRVMQYQGPEKNDLSVQYAEIGREMADLRAGIERLDAVLNGENLSAEQRTQAQTERQQAGRRLQVLEANLADLEQKGKHATIVVTLEAE